MSITRIKRLRDCGVFRDFRWQTDLPDFARYNLIYGWNGSGKTILSKIFRALEYRSEPLKGQLTVTVDGRDVSNHDFARVTLPLRVFNRDFIAESVFPIDGGGVAPIFVVGKENVENQKQVLKLKETLSREQTNLATQQKKKEDASAALDKFCIEKAKVMKDTLRSSGTNPYNEYNKADFTQRAKAMICAGDKDVHALSDATRENLLAQLRSSPKSKLKPLSYRLPCLKALGKKVADLLSTTVVSAAIKSLKDDTELSLWVHAGLGLHQKRNGEKCLFCEQPMPKKRLAALKAHFNTEYDDLLMRLDEQITMLKAANNAAKDLAIPKAMEFYDDLSPDFESAASALCGERDTATHVLEQLARALENKKARPFEPVALEVTVPELNADVLDSLNGVIQKHNQASDDFQSRIGTTRGQLEANSVATGLEEFVKLQCVCQTAEHGVTKANDEIQRLSGEITKLEREIVEHRQPAEELNEDLRNYLGHAELWLEVKKDPGYTIMRHDTPAESLSEGETTAIALLHFLKSLQDRRFDLANGVVVLDDPVSSLDANALYSAFGFIRERTEKAAQLVILTHNFAFFCQVRNWFHHLKGQKKPDIAKRPARFYMLDCTFEQQHRCSHIRALDPLLEEFNSEYHFLFAYVYRAATAAPRTSLEKNYLLPNLARRLLESFLAFRLPQISGELWAKLKRVQFDQTKKTRIIRFLHTYSHSSAIAEPEHDLSLLSESHAILNDLLDLMRSEDEKHYSAIVELVKSAATDADEDAE